MDIHMRDHYIYVVTADWELDPLCFKTKEDAVFWVDSNFPGIWDEDCSKTVDPETAFIDMDDSIKELQIKVIKTLVWERRKNGHSHKRSC